MDISDFLALSPTERLNFAPIMAKYNLCGTRAFENLIRIINRRGFGSLSFYFKMGFLLNLANVPNSELHK